MGYIFGEGAYSRGLIYDGGVLTGFYGIFSFFAIHCRYRNITNSLSLNRETFIDSILDFSSVLGVALKVSLVKKVRKTPNFDDVLK